MTSINSTSNKKPAAGINRDRLNFISTTLSLTCGKDQDHDLVHDLAAPFKAR